MLRRPTLHSIHPATYPSLCRTTDTSFLRRAERKFRLSKMVSQSQPSWGAIERVEKDYQFIPRPPIAVANDQIVAWLIAIVRIYCLKLTQHRNKV